MKNDLVGFHLETQYHALLTGVAAHHGKSVAQWLREIAAEGLRTFSARNPDEWARINQSQLPINVMTVIRRPGRPKKEV